jgi:hypothetical protein
MSIADYLDAAENKIALARADYADLEALREGAEHERRGIQRAFEGVIGNGFSAGDQAWTALAAAAGLKPRRRPPDKLRRALANARVSDELVPCISALEAWTDESIVHDARKRRNRAIHHYYEKKPYKPHGTWLLKDVTPRGEPSSYHGSLEVHSYCETFVDALAVLERALDCIRAHM